MDAAFWISHYSQEDLEPYQKAGFAQMGFGKKPALLNVDMTYMFFDPSYATAYGDMSRLLESVTVLTKACREKNVPLFYSRRDDRSNYIGRGLWNEKLKTSTSKSYTSDAHADEWPPEFGPKEGDVIIYKNKPSPFFGTPLSSMLAYIGVDTLIVIGISTSGCVRAAVNDAFSYNIRPIVPLQCTGDRCARARWANLFDMDMKFADVLPLEEVLDYIKTT